MRHHLSAQRFTGYTPDISGKSGEKVGEWGKGRRQEAGGSGQVEGIRHKVKV